MENLLITDGFVLKKKISNYSYIISWNDEIRGNNIVNFNLFIEENASLIRDKYIDWVELLPYMNFNNGRIIDILQIHNRDLLPCLLIYLQINKNHQKVLKVYFLSVLESSNFHSDISSHL